MTVSSKVGSVGARIVPALALLGAALTTPASAQIATDGTVGPAVALSGPNYQIGADLGTQVGGNLFHSFEQFGIHTLGDGTVESATFTGPADIANVISRVTGGDVSEINGQLRSEVGTAGFYFINPAGVTFGPNASLDVPGSFHVSTADQLRFADDATFSATDPETSTLTLAPPEAFGFLGDNPQPISIDGTLAVEEHREISIVGGDITIDGGFVYAPQGRISLAAVDGDGEVALDDPELPTDQGGMITLTGQAGLDVLGDGGGTVLIRGGRLVVENSSSVFAENSGSMDSKGRIDVRMAQDVEIRAGGQIIYDAQGAGDGSNVRIQADTIIIDGFIKGVRSGIFGQVRSSGDGGSLLVQARKVEIRNGGSIITSTHGDGDAGSVTIEADTLIVDGAGPEGTTLTSIAAQAHPGSSGDAGNILIRAQDVELLGGGRIATGTGGDGDAGGVTIEADTLTIDGAGALAVITSQTDPGSSGRGGDIRVTAQDVEILRGGYMANDTRGDGDAGGVTIVADTLTIDGAGAPAVISSQTDTGSSGRGGDIRVTAQDVEILRGGQIASNTRGDGDAGSVTIVADTLTIDDAGLGALTGILGLALQSSRGDAGSILVQARKVGIRDGGSINSSTLGEGDGGSVIIDADTLVVDGAGPDGPRLTSIASQAYPGSSGDGGTILVRAQNVELRSRGRIATDAGGGGDAGGVTIEADTLTIDGAGALAVISSQTGTGSSGRAGDIQVMAQDVEILRGGYIANNTRGDGDAGNVTIETGTLTIDRAGATLPTGISNEAGEGSSGRAGDIQVTAQDVEILDGGEMSSSTKSEGDAGTIQVTAHDVEIRGGSVISSATFSDGAGGNVDVAGMDRLVLDGAQITATSEAPSDGGPAGRIRVTVPTTLELRNGASIETEARSGTGGSIEIVVGDIVDLEDSRITTSVTGTGAGSADAGNIDIDPRFLVLDSSLIQANAAVQDGGRITIEVGDLIRSPDSEITATGGTEGVPGEIIVSGTETDLVGELAALPATFLVSEQLFEQSCAARSGQPVSSLVSAGRGGLPADPEQPLGALYLADRPIAAVTDRNESMAGGNDTGHGGETALVSPVAVWLDCGG